MVWKKEASKGSEFGLETTVSRCEEIIKRLKDAIDDETKAGPDYRDLAKDIQEMFCGGACPKGFLAKINLQGIAKDEDKHKELIEQLLVAATKECEEKKEQLLL